MTAGLAVLMLALLWLTMMTLNWRIQRTLSLIQQEIEPVAKIAGDIESKRQVVSAVERQFANRRVLSHVLEELSYYTENTL